MEAPDQVKRAVFLLWLSLGLATLSAFVEWEPVAPEDRAFAIEIATLVAVVTLVQAALIYFASKRRNWARILLLVTLILGALAYVVVPGESEPWWYWLSVGCSFLLDGVAIYWLFSGVGAAWYKNVRAEGAP